jgi:hypothetical protein
VTTAGVGVVLALAAAFAAPAAAFDAAGAGAGRDAIVRGFAALPVAYDGNVFDPVSRTGAPPYTQAMLGLAALRSSQATGDAAAGAFAERMLTWVARHPPRREGSVFELDAVVAAYEALPPASPLREALAGWLRAWPAPAWIERRAGYVHNKQLVHAHALLRLCRLGLQSAAGGACRRARTLITRDLPAAARPFTELQGGRATTVLADPPRTAPAYHQLVLGFLARSLPDSGGARAVRRLVVSMARGSVALAAPDGDSAYWGRSQEQAWALLYGAYGLRVAAGLAGDPSEAAGFAATAERLLARFERLHQGGPYGIFVTPAFRRDPFAVCPGLDDYANVASYAGLTAVGLDWLAGVPPPRRGGRRNRR